MNTSSSIRLHATVVAASFVLTCAFPAVRAENPEETTIHEHITVTQRDLTAAANIEAAFFHVRAANVPGAKEGAAALHAENARRLEESGIRGPEDAAKAALLTGPNFYPADVKKGTGPTLATTTHHPIYVNFTGTVAANWGNPEQFLKDLNASTFIHLVDQYGGSTASNRYPVGGNAAMTYTLYGNVLYEHDILAIAHAAAAHFGAGTGHLYHLFLTKGIDTCFDLTRQCYSPDHSQTFVFCAYHDAAMFTDIGTVLFTVEPYQDVNGCAEATPASPQGQLADSTNTALSHEVFEAISDPVPLTGYFNQTTFLYTAEVGDECLSAANSLGDYLDPTLTLNGKPYKAQLEYSNTYHTCAAVP